MLSSHKVFVVDSLLFLIRGLQLVSLFNRSAHSAGPVLKGIGVDGLLGGSVDGLVG